MSTNLIQNYIHKPIQQQQVSTQKPKPNFDIQQELNNRTFIKPLKGKGKLLNVNILSAPIDTFKDIKYDIKSVKHAMQGKANDHELGKINDLGMLAGGLAIASYLFTKKTTPLTKGMEFVGFASFFASMAIWPKLAIQLPAYLIHGVNVQKEYQDSFGRKKPFYQDPQFIPWDLYSDKEIDKIGDRLKVPRDIPNRRDFIQERMRKLAIQNNTLWMLTAGFATPIMSALICNQAEPILLKYQNEQKNKKADNILANLESYSTKYQTHSTQKRIEEIIKANGNKPLNKELSDAIFEALSADMDFVTSDSLKYDLKQILSDGKYSINDTTAKNIAQNLQQKFAGKEFAEEFLATVLPNEKETLQLLADNGFINNSYKGVEHTAISNKIVDEIIKRAENFNATHPDLAEDIDYIKELINANKTEEHPIISALRKTKSSVLDEGMQGRLKGLASIVDDFRAKNLSLDEYAYIKVGSAPETVIANYWNGISQDFIETLGITTKELEKVKFDKNLMGALLRDKLETIVSDKSTYNKVLEHLVEKIATINSQIKSSDLASHLLTGNNNLSVYEDKVQTIFGDFANKLREQGFGKTANAIIGTWGNEKGSYVNIQKAFAENRLLGVKSSFNRLISTFDLYRRIATNPNSLTHINGEMSLAREVKEELIELCKIIMLDGHSSDFATKFYMHRNPTPSSDMSPVEVVKGKVKNKYFGHTSGTADIPSDKYFYQNAMKFMFGDDIHPDTKAILERNISLKEEFSRYRQLVWNRLGGDKYFAKPRHRVANSAYTGSDIKFLLTGIAPDELFYKAGQQAFNTKKWLKIFGGFGAGLLALTVFAQFFLGKIKPPRQVKNND